MRHEKLRAYIHRKTPILSLERCFSLSVTLMKNHNRVFFPSDFEKLFSEHFIGQMFKFCGPPLLTFKTDRSDISGLDLGVSDVIYSLVKRFSA